MSIGVNIKYIRKIANLTQKEFADKIGISRNALINYEKGKRVPPIDVLFSISKAFNVSVDEITGLNYDVASSGERPYNYSEICHSEHLDTITEDLSLDSAFHLILKELNCDFSLMDKLDYEFFETSLLRYAKFLYTEILNNKK